MDNNETYIIHGWPEGEAPSNAMGAQQLLAVLANKLDRLSRLHIAISIECTADQSYAIVGFYDDDGFLSVASSTSHTPATTVSREDRIGIYELWVQNELTEFSTRHFVPIATILPSLELWLAQRVLDKCQLWEHD